MQAGEVWIWILPGGWPETAIGMQFRYLPAPTTDICLSYLFDDVRYRSPREDLVAIIKNNRLSGGNGPLGLFK